MVAVFNRHGLPDEIFDQVANKAFYRCLNRHDPTKGNSFSSSLYQFMEWECQDQLRKNFSYLKFINSLPAKKETNNKDTEMIKDCLEAIGEEYCDILTKRYIDCYTIEEIRESLSLSHMNTINLLRTAEEAFKREWAS